ncbi:MAG: efflux RND transporter periplasmic adaptor subunit [Deltaproteobacteria bacterium]|nr:efflux RND transporter periplasmic adaptor subunit [Deltaproteobacteria bacterium]
MHFNRIVCKFLKMSVLLAFLSAGLLFTGCERKQQAPPPRSLSQVTTLTVETQKVILTTELPGRTAAFRIAEIRPQVSGLILKRLFTEGSDVKAGQVLYQIDPAPFQATLNNSLAALGRAEATLPSIKARAERYRDLLADKAVSQQEYDDAAAALIQVEADIRYYQATLETARINLDYTEVTAPISGRIGRSKVTEGAIVTAYQPVALATIQQLDPIYVDVPQSTTEHLYLQRRLQDGRLQNQGSGRNQVKLILEDNTAYSSQGELQFRDVTVDPTTGSVILRVVFANPQGVLLPGMFVRAILNEGVKEQAILVPQQVVSRDPKGNPLTLIVTAENKVQLQRLTLDRALGDKWLVASGLAPGDRVIVEGRQRVRPGAEVKVVSPKGSDPDRGPNKNMVQQSNESK